jgi:DNA-binding winged helix-turn-helix (wHTH) protein
MTHLYRVFIASPSDVEAECKIAKRVVEGLNGSLAEMGRNQRFELLTWGQIHPDLSNPQKIILNQVSLKQCDIFVAILWKRLGRPTGTSRPTDQQPYLSGTQHEIDEAIAARQASKVGRPVIMIYRKIDLMSAEMSDEDFHQLSLVREYLRRFEPEGENPALIRKFESSLFESVLHEDLIRVLYEFQPLETATGSNFETRTISIGGDAVSSILLTGANNLINIDGIRQDSFLEQPAEPASDRPGVDVDHIADWLRLVGLASHPFEQNRAELEQSLQQYFVSPRGLRAQSLANPPNPSVVFGGAGCGKTALRTIITQHCYPLRPDSDTLCIVYDRTELEKLVSGPTGQLSRLTQADFATSVINLTVSKLMLYAPSLVAAHLREVGWVQGQSFHEPLTPTFQSLASLINKSGFKCVLFLIDQLDEMHVMQTQPGQMTTTLEAIMALEVREAHALAFCYFLPKSIASQLRSWNSVFRLERCDVYHLEWTDDMLRRLIRQRLVYHSVNQSAPYNSIGQLCDNSDGLAETIDSELIDLAARNPRALLWLARELIQRHCEDGDTLRLIRPKTWADVKTYWLLEGQPIFFPLKAFWLLKDRVFFYTREIVLSGLGLSLLSCLIRAEGRICDHLELVRAGWPNTNPEGTTHHAVEQAILRLKQDLNKQGIDSRWILRVRGRGFRLGSPSKSLSADGEEEESNNER